MSYWNWTSWQDEIPAMNSFEDVERIYNDTKPVISKLHTEEDDIRPYGKRSHKSRRIVKVSRDCYTVMTHGESLPQAWALSVYRGMYLPEDPDERRAHIAKSEARRKEALAVPKSHYEKYGCVVWRRHRDGAQTLRLRNSYTNYATGHLMSLREVLPSFVMLGGRRYGMHTVQHRGKTYMFPLSTMISPWLAKTHPYYAGKKGVTPREDGRYLLFRRSVEGEWSLEYDCEHLADKIRPLVDTEAKAPYRKDMAHFRDWCVATYAMLGHESVRQAFWDMDTAEKRGSVMDMTKADWRRLVADHEHPLRWVAALHLLQYDNTTRSHQTWLRECETDFKVRQRNNLNRKLNQLLGFVNGGD